MVNCKVEANTTTRMAHTNESSTAVLCSSSISDSPLILAAAASSAPKRPPQSRKIKEHVSEANVGNICITDSPFILAAAASSAPKLVNSRSKKRNLDHLYPPLKKPGRWTSSEHAMFLYGMSIHGRNWKKVQVYLPTRSSTQIRSHAQKYFSKFNGIGQDDEYEYYKYHDSLCASSRSIISIDESNEKEESQCDSSKLSSCPTEKTIEQTNTMNKMNNMDDDHDKHNIASALLCLRGSSLLNNVSCSSSIASTKSTPCACDTGAELIDLDEFSNDSFRERVHVVCDDVRSVVTTSTNGENIATFCSSKLKDDHGTSSPVEKDSTESINTHLTNVWIVTDANAIQEEVNETLLRLQQLHDKLLQRHKQSTSINK